MADARLENAEALLRNGQAGQARSALTAILASAGATPDDRRVALVLRSQACEALGDIPGAIGDLNTAIASHPRDPRLRNSLGLLLADSGDAQGAIDALTFAVELDPTFARAWNNLGSALRTQGRVGEALQAARRAVAAQPDYALAWTNLGMILFDLGDDAGAREAFRRALALKPDLRTIRALAGIARQRGDIDDAVDLYRRARASAPNDSNTLLNLAGALAERDDEEESRSVYLDARARHPDLLRAAFGEALALPMVYPDAAAVEASRASFARGLARLESEVSALVRGRSFADVIDDLRWTNFLLAYQGEDDRELQTRFAAIMGRAIDAVAPRMACSRGAAGGRRTHSRRLRVVFFLRRDLRPLFSELDRRARPLAL